MVNTTLRLPKIQLNNNWEDPNRQKEKLKVQKPLVVWSDNETKLNDISRYFNMGNKKRAYLTFWIKNIMASREVWEFYGKLPKQGEPWTKTPSGRYAPLQATARSLIPTSCSFFFPAIVVAINDHVHDVCFVVNPFYFYVQDLSTR